MVCLGRVASLSYAILHRVGAVVADLRVALFEIPSITVVISIELLVVWVGRVVRQVLRQGGCEEALVLETRFTKDDFRVDSGRWLVFGVLRGRGFSLRRDGGVCNIAMLEAQLGECTNVSRLWVRLNEPGLDSLWHRRRDRESWLSCRHT